jgi:signal transduction histidine kinase
VLILAGSGLLSTHRYRSIVKGLSWRSEELPFANKLSGHVASLRIVLGELRGRRANRFPPSDMQGDPLGTFFVREQFRTGLEDVETTLAEYREKLEKHLGADSEMGDNRQEWETVSKIETALEQVLLAQGDKDWTLDGVQIDLLNEKLAELQQLADKLPTYLYDRFTGFADAERNQYRTMYVGTWIAACLAAMIFALVVNLFYRWIFRPLRSLIEGSRCVAAGDFDYRIHLCSEDEMSELAEAMNDMTQRFQDIRDDLDRQVRERTRQVVRSERLAGVGFLAAGVAHEINNPLASIAMCAESLESRLLEDQLDGREPDPLMQKYLQMIQNEAFRCKEITEKLLDFSRVGPAKRQTTVLSDVVAGVIDMVRHIGKYQHKKIEFSSVDGILASVNSQEIKQVVLNLLTNALDCVEDEKGVVRIEMTRRDGFAEVTFIDNGCGMTEDVLEHVFEPFFTRRTVGQGTGLGLSITHRIVSDHGGEIEAHSDGPGRGATFRVRLPIVLEEKNVNNHRAA